MEPAPPLTDPPNRPADPAPPGGPAPKAGAAPAEGSWPPAGWVDRAEAHGVLGVSRQGWLRLCGEGRVTCGRWFKKPGARGNGVRDRLKLYALAELEALASELRLDPPLVLEADGSGGYRAPAGFVDWRGACEILGVMRTKLSKLQRQGRIRRPSWARFPAGSPSGAKRVYPVEELAHLAEELNKVGQPYPDPARPGVWRVPVVSWVKAGCEALVDEADLPLVAGKRWNWAPMTRAEDSKVVLATASGEQTPMRRIILGLTGRQWRIAHANGDPLDCRRANLVVRNYTEQMGRAKKRRTTHGGRPCTSRFKGVSRDKRGGKWNAQIKKDGHLRRLGRFRSEIAAAQAYDEAARELFGEHARPNFPDGVDAWIEASHQRKAA